ncbi:MAG: 5'-methylthioadenosine/S-adenosylhomocysteine nucleosidase [Alphaproteobacteria bacterium]|nr:5'-methylthioadenosine/S-adenosylhomocysteine nucleosidase [Alphaproteobacteria bacterium]
MNTIAIITAMDSEFNAILSLYDFKLNNANIMEASAHNKTIYLIKSGIGKVNAALCANFAIQNGADMVLNTGLAGGISDDLNQGDVVLADKVCYHDVWCGEPNLKGQVQDMPLFYKIGEDLLLKLQNVAKDNGYKIGLAVTGDQFLTDVNRLMQIKEDFPEAIAVDMESAAIAQTCYVNNKPFLSLRIISDVVGKTNQVEQYNAFWQNMPQMASIMVDRIIQSL